MFYTKKKPYVIMVDYVLISWNWHSKNRGGGNNIADPLSSKIKRGLNPLTPPPLQRNYEILHHDRNAQLRTQNMDIMFWITRTQVFTSNDSTPDNRNTSYYLHYTIASPFMLGIRLLAMIVKYYSRPRLTYSQASLIQFNSGNYNST